MSDELLSLSLSEKMKKKKKKKKKKEFCRNELEFVLIKKLFKDMKYKQNSCCHSNEMENLKNIMSKIPSQTLK